jgi:hypothetical protein
MSSAAVGRWRGWNDELRKEKTTAKGKAANTEKEEQENKSNRKEVFNV